MLRLAVATVAVLFSVTATAQDLSYNHIVGGYQRVDLDDDFGLDVDGDRFTIGGSFAVGESWYLFANYALSDFDFGVELDEISAGIGFHAPLTPSTDVIAEIGFASADISSPIASVDDNGYAVSVGVRSMVSSNVELAGAVTYADIGDFDSETTVNGAAWYNLSEQFGLGLTITAGDDVTSYGLGARVYFGN